MTGFMRFAFGAAVLLAVVLALWPSAPDLPGDPSDVLQHAAAFLTLTVLGGLAYPRAPLVVLFGAMALLGAGIELAQMIPQLHRQADSADLMVDVLAAAAGLLVVAGVRRWQGRDAERAEHVESPEH